MDQAQITQIVSEAIRLYNVAVIVPTLLMVMVVNIAVCLAMKPKRKDRER